MPIPIPSLIPYPNQLDLLTGHFPWSSQINIQAAPPLAAEIDTFLAALPENLRPKTTNPAADQILHVEIAVLNADHYQMEISPLKIHLQAGSLTSLFHGMQTLRQLIDSAALNQAGGTTLAIPCLRISDHPRFAWRGFMLDEGRHFHGMKTVKYLLDWMAYFKLNIFHWHLTEDQGWRIEIRQYPNLTKIGAKRRGSQTGGLLGRKLDRTPHVGFYTQAEIREIVNYAAQRHIAVIPEIEIPGHSLAALAAYPELGCTGAHYQVTPYWGIHQDIYCAGKPGTLQFLENVLGEVLEIFPAPYVHIGGDEAPKQRWRRCPECKNRAAALGLQNMHQLQTHMTNQIGNFLKRNDRQIIGWNEMLDGSLDPNAVVQYWVGKEKTLINHTRQGRKAILSQWSTYYLDHTYAHSALDKVYQFEPIFANLEPQFHTNILGIEAPLWTEYVPTQARLDWQTFPRLLAFAESAWLQPQHKDYNFFEHRLQRLLPILDAAGVGYAPLEAANPSPLARMGGPLSLIQAVKGERGV
ncbi:MAG: beta-N-acetylhexosaminidase [Chloroflexi bacterium HGW-Chloroflexi-10]|nr:MAG: beta-N-acetylhexosaminidase [Chloroflexi bacterium HGW-Chloroflexi-10]